MSEEKAERQSVLVFMANGHDLGYLWSTASERRLQREKEHPVEIPASPPVANIAATKPTIPMPALLLAMLHVSNRVSDLIFSPGSLPHVEVSGELVPVKIPGVQVLAAQDTHRISGELIGSNKQAIASLHEQGSCDISYSLPGQCRFRVNIFVQRGSHAIVMRVIPKSIPSFSDLKLPPQLAEIASLRNGVVLVTGPTGSGKSSTMAAILEGPPSETARATPAEKARREPELVIERQLVMLGLLKS